MATSERFWDKTSRKYAASPVKDMAAYRTTLARTREHLGPEDNVLELGCGTGSTALLLAKDVGRYLGTDYSQGMIAIANEKMAAARRNGGAPDNLAFLTASVFDERVEPEVRAPGYDAILAFNFLHLVENPERLLKRVHDLLRPGGLFISKTVCLAGRAWLFRPLIGVMQLFGKAPFVNFLTIGQSEQIIAEAGFETIETGNYPEPYSRFVVARKL